MQLQEAVLRDVIFKQADSIRKNTKVVDGKAKFNFDYPWMTVEKNGSVGARKTEVKTATGKFYDVLSFVSIKNGALSPYTISRIKYKDEQGNKHFSRKSFRTCATPNGKAERNIFEIV